METNMETNTKINDILAQETIKNLDEFNDILIYSISKLKENTLTEQELVKLKSNIQTIQNGIHLFYHCIKDLDEDDYDTTNIKEKYDKFSHNLQCIMNIIDKPNKDTLIIGYVGINDIKQLEKIAK